MSAAVAPTLTARQLVQSLPEPFRAAVLAELLRDRAAGPAPKPDDFPVLTPERQAEMVRRASDTRDKFMSFEEMKEWIRTADLGEAPESPHVGKDATSRSS